jgi:hypothetical protein
MVLQKPNIIVVLAIIFKSVFFGVAGWWGSLKFLGRFVDISVWTKSMSLG